MKSIPPTDVDPEWLAWAAEAAQMLRDGDEPEMAEGLLEAVQAGEIHVPCPMQCGDLYCLKHDDHFADCDCPGDEEYEIDPTY
jgi:hypothetical protein